MKDTLLNCDCRDFMTDLDPKSIQLVLVDPPYGISLTDHHFGKKSRRWDIQNDGCLGLSKFIYGWCEASKVPLAMFYSPFVPRPGKFRSILAWSKGGHVGGGGDIKTCWKRDFELIGVSFNGRLNGGRDNSVLSFSALSPPPTGHVAEKPVDLMKYLVRKLTNPGDTVFDPCMGSGTVAVAARQLGRRFIGCEVDPKWFKVAVARHAKAGGIKSL